MSSTNLMSLLKCLLQINIPLLDSTETTFHNSKTLYRRPAFRLGAGQLPRPVQDSRPNEPIQNLVLLPFLVFYGGQSQLGHQPPQLHRVYQPARSVARIQRQRRHHQRRNKHNQLIGPKQRRRLWPDRAGQPSRRPLPCAQRTPDRSRVKISAYLNAI